MNRLYLLSVLILVLFLVLSGQAGWGAEQTYTFGTYPFGNAETIQRAFTPLVQRIGQEAGIPLKLIITRDYGELSERLVDRSVDFAWIGSTNYIKTRLSVPDLKYLATYQEWDATSSFIQSYYQSVILTLASSPFHSLESLAGKRFGFTDPDSASGYAFPNLILRKTGIVPGEFFGSVFFLGTHNNVIQALVAESLDAGAVSDGTYYAACREYGDIFRVLATSEPIPLDALVAAPHVPEPLVTAVRDILVSLSPDDPVNQSILDVLQWPAAGFAVEEPALYDSLYEALENR